jgi:hypothetical protein
MTDTQNQQDQGQTQEQEEPKSFKQKKTFERDFVRLRRALELTISDPQLKTLADQFGHNDAKLAEGAALAAEVQRLYENQKNARAEKLQATETYRNLKKIADISAAAIVKTARIAFKNDRGTYEALGLSGPRLKAYGDWLEQNQLLYSHLLSRPGAVEEIAKYNITLEQIQAGQQELTDTMEADKHQEDAKAESQKATELKNIAYRDFKKFMRRFIKVMTVALEDDPQMKEKLGIVTPSKI